MKSATWTWLGLRTIMGCLLTSTTFSQTSFELVNRRTGVLAPVFSAEGVPLAGTNYLAELWGGDQPDRLQPLVVLDTQERIIGTFARGSGYILAPQPGPLVVPTVPAGWWAWLQLRAWDSRLGATYEAAVARGIGGVGESPLFYARGSNPSDYKALPGSLIGLQSFRLRPATGVLMHSIRREGFHVVVEWFGGFKQYRLQARAALDIPWQDSGAPTTNLTATVTPADGARFFRVIGLLE